jgi:hypothetical protein
VTGNTGKDFPYVPNLSGGPCIEVW